MVISILLSVLGLCSVSLAFVPSSVLNNPALLKRQHEPPTLSFRRPSWTTRNTGSGWGYRLKKDCISLFAGSDEEKTPLRIIIAGAPASGKGTQCELIQKNYGVVHLSTGDMLRAAVAAGSEVGKSAKEYMDSGKLVPDEVITGVVKDRLAESDCQTNGWLLDGFPRTKNQADALTESNICADCFLFLNVPDEILVERVVGRRTDPETGKIYHMTFSPPDDEEVKNRLVQRSDDTEEKVVVRLEQFHANVNAVKGCYENVLVEIDGSEKPDVVAEAVDKALQSTSTK